MTTQMLDRTEAAESPVVRTDRLATRVRDWLRHPLLKARAQINVRSGGTAAWIASTTDHVEDLRGRPAEDFRAAAAELDETQPA